MLRISGRVILFTALFCFTGPDLAKSQQVQAFADVNYIAGERGAAGGFVLGQLAGHTAIGLSDRVAVFSEVSLTGRSTGYTIELERLMLRYEFSDYLKLSGGRYHTPISHWNTAFHHGMWLQTSVGRPEYVKFGSRFIPVHFVGLLAEGSFPSMALGPGYFAGFGNGRGANIARAGDAGDVNDRRAWLAGVYVRPARIYGLEAGVALYRDRVGDDPQTDETIYSVYAVWAKERPEVIAEFAHVVHDPVDELGESAGSNAYYVQLAYRLPGRLSDLKPYARFERIETALSDPLFGPLGLDYEAGIAGVRFDFAMMAALKVEYRNAKFGDDGRDGILHVQVSFTFPGATM